MAAAQMLASLTFAEPPVRSTQLSVMFEQSSHVLSAQLAPLHAKWMTQLPVIEESAPDFEDIDIAGEDPSGNAWPLPSTKFVSADGTMSLTLQEGRLDLTWDKAEDPYPGFEHLAAVLSERFTELGEALASAGVSIRLKSSRCVYQNQMEGLTGPELAAGILTNWTAPARPDLISKGYVGVRIHACADVEIHKCSSYVMVDGSSGDVPRFTISVKRRLKKDEDSILGGLHEAHEELLELFLQFTSEDQQRDWGRSG